MEILSDELRQAIEQFNQKQFYKCHDTLEALWMESSEPEKTFYQGILQIAVGLYHLSNQNWRGACILLGEGISRLNYYRPNYCHINVESLLIESHELLTALQVAGADKIADFQSLVSEGEVDNGLNLSPILIKLEN